MHNLNPRKKERPHYKRGGTVAERFWRYVIQHATGCWGWRGATQAPGYGKLAATEPGRVIYAHRVSWEIHNGPVPAGLFVLHHCDNPVCSRPDHLFVGTQAENLLDMRLKGRGSKPPNRWAQR